MNYEQLTTEQKRLEEQIKDLELQLENYPEGKLICARNGTGYKWYHRQKGQTIYLPKRKRQLAEQLAAQKYLSLLLDDLRHEKKALDSYISHLNARPKQSEKMLSQHSEFRSLLSAHFKPIDKTHEEWLSTPYDRNLQHPEHLIHKTYSGNLVRSKSEAIIDMLLFLHKIPFRYECALLLGETILYPDFTIRHPHTSQIFYWEHFGLMDDPTYCKNTFSKLHLYSANGIVPGIQLITTYETLQHPLCTDEVERVISNYFL